MLTIKTDASCNVGKENSGPHGLLFLNGTINPQIGIIPLQRSAMAYYDKIFNVVNIQPDAFVVTSVEGVTHWEGRPQRTSKSNLLCHST
jgi:hypothetical protein